MHRSSSRGARPRRLSSPIARACFYGQPSAYLVACRGRPLHFFSVRPIGPHRPFARQPRAVYGYRTIMCLTISSGAVAPHNGGPFPRRLAGNLCREGVLRLEALPPRTAPSSKGTSRNHDEEGQMGGPRRGTRQPTLWPPTCGLRRGRRPVSPHALGSAYSAWTRALVPTAPGHRFRHDLGNHSDALGHRFR